MVRIEVLVKTGSSQQKLVKSPEAGTYTAYLHSRPHKNAANTELIELLSKELKIRKTAITIKKGQKNKLKQIELSED